MATSNNDRISSARLLDMLKGLQESRHLGSEPEVDPQTNEKTKHTIKQDYLPNADWNVNDPDADGYVQGRTHWVERTVGDIPVTIEKGVPTIPDMVKPEGFKFGTTTWKPDYEAIAFEEAEYGMTYTGYLLAEDENGIQVTDASIIFSDDSFYTGVCVIDVSAVYGQNAFWVIGRLNNTEITPDYVIGVGDVVHKLDRKFIDWENGEYPDTVVNPDNDYSKINSTEALGKNLGYTNSRQDYVGLTVTESAAGWAIQEFVNTSGSYISFNICKKLNKLADTNRESGDLINTLLACETLEYKVNGEVKRYTIVPEQKVYTGTVKFEDDNENVIAITRFVQRPSVEWVISGDNLEAFSEIQADTVILTFRYNTPSIFRENSIELPIEDGGITTSKIADSNITPAKMSNELYELTYENYPSMHHTHRDSVYGTYNVREVTLLGDGLCIPCSIEFYWVGTGYRTLFSGVMVDGFVELFNSYVGLYEYSFNKIIKNKTYSNNTLTLTLKQYSDTNDATSTGRMVPIYSKQPHSDVFNYKKACYVKFKNNQWKPAIFKLNKEQKWGDGQRSIWLIDNITLEFFEDISSIYEEDIKDIAF